MEHLEQTSYNDLLLYAQQLSNAMMEIIPKSAMASKEGLVSWISDNEPNYDPEDLE